MASRWKPDSDANQVATNGNSAAPTLSLPKGGGAIRGIGEKFSVNSVNGTASLTVPIFTTPSRSDFYPKLFLSYDSGAGNGPFGLGWSLSVPSITRKTDRGVPQYRDFEDSDVFILSEAEDLVPVLVDNGGQWSKQPITFPQGGTVYVIQRYRPRIEGLFARIEQWRDTVSGNTFWLSISRDNVISVYGATPQARISDPQDASHIFTWLLEETLDDRGNVVIYEYKQEDRANIDPSLPQEATRLANGQGFATRYLKRIRYGNQKPRTPLIRAGGDDPASRPSIEAALAAHRNADDFHFQVVFDY